jgi:hypothetical protein
MADPTLDDEIPGFKYSYTPSVAPSDKVGVTVAPAPASYVNAKPIAKAPISQGPDIENLQPDLKERVDVLRDLWKNNKELNPKGEDLPISSGYRTKEQQREEYLNRLKNPNLVAEPGKSRHEKGDAIDIHPRVSDSLLTQVGLYRPYGSKDPVHVQINPDLPYESKPYDVNTDEEAPGFKFKYNPKKFTAAEDLAMAFEDMKKTPGKLAKTFASAADTALSGIPAAAQFVAEPVAKLVDRIGDTKVAENALKKATSYFDRPVGKAFGITNDPVYNAEATHRLMDYVGEHVDKGADWIAENTGMDKSDAAWFLNAAALKAAPMVGRAAKATGKAIHENVTAENAGNLLSELSGRLSTQNPFNTKEAYKAGFEKDPSIKQYAEPGAVSAPDVVGNVRQAFEKVKENRSKAYKEGIKTTKGNQVFLDFKPIREAFNENVESLKSKNLGAEELKAGEETMVVVDKIGKILDRWEKKPELHTAGNLDDLKQRIDDVYSQGMTDQAKRVMTSTRNAVKETISKQDPNYEKTMADYEKGLEFEREIKNALGLGPKAGVDTTIRKLSQIFSGKSNLSKEYRLELLQELGGKDVVRKLVGYSMGQEIPSGVKMLADVMIGYGAHLAGSPEAGIATAASLMAAQSPKVALHVAYGAGRTARAVSDIGQSAKAQVAKGKTKLSELTSRK